MKLLFTDFGFNKLTLLAIRSISYYQMLGTDETRIENTYGRYRFFESFFYNNRSFRGSLFSSGSSVSCAMDIENEIS